MQVNRQETARYLGLHGRTAGEETDALIEACAGELEAAAVPRRAYRRVPVGEAPYGVVLAGDRIESRDLAERLHGCREAFLLAVTLGAPVDRLLHKYGRVDVARAAVLHAASIALLEEWEARCEEELLQALRPEGAYLKPRFGPGYGDFSLNCQALILHRLHAGKRMGMTLTEGGMLLPSKSCTAVLGITKTGNSCPLEKCRLCGDHSCPYRKA